MGFIVINASSSVTARHKAKRLSPLLSPHHVPQENSRVLVIVNRPLGADSGLAIRFPECHTGRSVCQWCHPYCPPSVVRVGAFDLYAWLSDVVSRANAPVCACCTTCI